MHRAPDRFLDRPANPRRRQRIQRQQSRPDHRRCGRHRDLDIRSLPASTRDHQVMQLLVPGPQHPATQDGRRPSLLAPTKETQPPDYRSLRFKGTGRVFRLSAVA